MGSGNNELGKQDTLRRGARPDADTIFSDTCPTNAPQNATKGVNAD
jgi:hypothetical protein